MIKFKKFWVGIGEFAQIFFFLWWALMIVFAFWYDPMSQTGDLVFAKAFGISFGLMILSAILWLIGHCTWMSGLICYDNSNSIYGHEWDENWRDR